MILETGRILTFAILISLAAQAQPAFSGLATNRDGSKLWFSTALRQRGTDHYAHAKIYTWGAGSGFRLVEQRDATLSFPPGGVTSSTYHLLVGASVSGDGSVVALTASTECIGFTMCALSSTRFQSTISIPGAAALSESGGANLSPNGRFALTGRSGALGRLRILATLRSPCAPASRSASIATTAAWLRRCPSRFFRVSPSVPAECPSAVRALPAASSSTMT